MAEVLLIAGTRKGLVLARSHDGRTRWQVDPLRFVMNAVYAVGVDDRRPTPHRRLQDEAGVLRRHVNVFVGDTNIRDAQQLDTPVRSGVDVTVLPAVSGG